jgi:hypothetical protein
MIRECLGPGLSAYAPDLGMALAAALLTGCWSIDQHTDTPIRLHDSHRPVRMRRHASIEKNTGAEAQQLIQEVVTL